MLCLYAIVILVLLELHQAANVLHELTENARNSTSDRKETRNSGIWHVVREIRERNNNQDIGQLVLNIITPMISGLNCLAIINDCYHQEVFSHSFFTTYQFPSYIKVLVEDNDDLLNPNIHILRAIRTIKHNGCRVYILLISNGGQLSRLLKFGDKYRMLNTRANFILLHDVRLFRPEMHYLWKKIVNVVFLKRYDGYTGINEKHKNTPWYEITTVPFPSPIRGILVPRRLDIWRSGMFHSGVDLFREKISDLRNQVMQVVTFQHIPSAVKQTRRSSHGRQTIGFGGLEIEVLRTIAAKMHFKSEVYEASNADKEKWGRKDSNGSLTGLLGEVVSGRAEIALGNLHYTPYHLDLMDLTIPYNTECLTFLTPELLTDNSWKTLILPFKPYMWSAVIVTLFLGGFIFHALSRFQKHLKRPGNGQREKNTTEEEIPEGAYVFGYLSNGILYTFGMLLLVSLPKVPSGWSLRLLTGWWWLYCVLVVVAYRASMTGILANPPPRVTIDTIEQLSESEIKCGGWGEQQKVFFTTSLDAAGKAIGKKFEVVYNDDAAVERVAKGEFAYYGNIHFLRHSKTKRQLLTQETSTEDKNITKEENEKNWDDRTLHIMRDCVINMPVSLGLQKNSPLKPRIDKFLRKIIEAGLVKKWLNDVMLSTTSKEPILQQEVSTNALMDVRKFYGALVALAIGYFVSLCVLLGELLHWQFIVKKSPFYDKYAIHIYYNKSRNSEKTIL